MMPELARPENAFDALIPMVGRSWWEGPSSPAAGNGQRTTRPPTESRACIAMCIRAAREGEPTVRWITGRALCEQPRRSLPSRRRSNTPAMMPALWSRTSRNTDAKYRAVTWPKWQQMWHPWSRKSTLDLCATGGTSRKAS